MNNNKTYKTLGIKEIDDKHIKKQIDNLIVLKSKIQDKFNPFIKEKYMIEFKNLMSDLHTDKIDEYAEIRIEEKIKDIIDTKAKAKNKSNIPENKKINKNLYNWNQGQKEVKGYNNTERIPEYRIHKSQYKWKNPLGF